MLKKINAHSEVNVISIDCVDTNILKRLGNEIVIKVDNVLRLSVYHDGNSLTVTQYDSDGIIDLQIVGH